MGDRCARLGFAIGLAGLGLAAPVRAQVVQITPDQAALRVRYEKGARVVLFYSYTCPYSRQAFPAFVSLARRYGAVGVSFLAFSLDDDAETLDAYLGRNLLPFDRQLLVGEGPGSIARAFAAEGIRVPARASTPSAVVIDGNGRLVGQAAGTGGPGRVDRWLRQLGFEPAD
ncbi:MAG: TlpA family protein disulfide reductase [Gemmatimonadales bacterium]